MSKVKKINCPNCSYKVSVNIYSFDKKQDNEDSCPACGCTFSFVTTVKIENKNILLLDKKGPLRGKVTSWNKKTKTGVLKALNGKSYSINSDSFEYYLPVIKGNTKVVFELCGESVKGVIPTQTDDWSGGGRGF